MNRVKSLLRRAVSVEFEWIKHARYLGVGVFSGLLNLVVYLAMSFGTDIAGPRWYAAAAGSTAGYIGHKLHSYGRGTAFGWKTIPKFFCGVGISILIYAGLTWALAQLFSFMPYFIIHIAAMCIGFLFSQQWNLRYTFGQKKPRIEVA